MHSLLVWALSTVLYGTLHIMCQHVYEHSITLWAPGCLSVGIPPVSVSAQFLSCSPGDDQGAGAYCPQYVLTVFLFVGFSSFRYVLSDYVGLWAKVAYLNFIYSLCALQDQFSNQIVIILRTNKSVFILSISSASFYQYQYFSIQLQLFLSSLLLVEFCTSACTLHHSRF